MKKRGAPKKPAGERVINTTVTLSPERLAEAKDKAEKYGFVFSTPKKAGLPNVSEFINHLIKTCE